MIHVVMVVVVGDFKETEIVRENGERSSLRAIEKRRTDVSSPIVEVVDIYKVFFFFMFFFMFFFFKPHLPPTFIISLFF